MKKTLKVILFTLLIIIVIAAGVLFVWYQIDGHPSPAANNYLNGENFTSLQEENGDWFFNPTHPNGKGVLIVHGALVYPKSYSKAAAYFAQQGYKVWMPMGDYRASILSHARITEQLEDMPETSWKIIGHSMGGFAAMTIADNTFAKIEAVAVWAGYLREDFSDLEVPVLFVTGSNDAMIPEEKLTMTKELLPGHTQFHRIEGGNHRNFALYTHQYFDGEATIEAEQQIDRALKVTAAFFNRDHSDKF